MYRSSLLCVALLACEPSGGSKKQPDASITDAGAPKTDRADAQPNSQGSTPDVGNVELDASKRFKKLSLVQLIATPERFHGSRVMVTGYWVPEGDTGDTPEGVLYLDRESAALALRQNALHVRFEQCRYASSTARLVDPEEGKNVPPGYTVIRGVLEPRFADDPWPHAGELCAISSLNRLPDTAKEQREAQLDEMIRRMKPLERSLDRD